jgi:hypothetical protein
VVSPQSADSIFLSLFYDRWFPTFIPGVDLDRAYLGSIAAHPISLRPLIHGEGDCPLLVLYHRGLRLRSSSSTTTFTSTSSSHPSIHPSPRTIHCLDLKDLIVGIIIILHQFYRKSLSLTRTRWEISPGKVGARLYDSIHPPLYFTSPPLLLHITECDSCLCLDTLLPSLHSVHCQAARSPRRIESEQRTVWPVARSLSH